MAGGAINRAPTYWQGEAWQVIVSKARYYGATVNVAPDAYLDDGLLHLCVITADTPIKSIEQAVSLLMHHKPDETTAKYFRGSHLSIRIPASIGMQVDGSVVKLEDYLRKAEREALKQADDAGQVMVNYRFDAVSAAVPMAIPHEASRTLFQRPSHEERTGPPPSQQKSAQAVQQVQREYQQRVEALQKQGYKVTVVGVVPHPTKTGTYIIAGRYKKEDTDETEVVAVRVNDRTLVLRQEGQDWASPAAVQELQEGDEIEVEGDKSKRGVIRARAVRLAH